MSDLNYQCQTVSNDYQFLVFESNRIETILLDFSTSEKIRYERKIVSLLEEVLKFSKEQEILVDDMKNEILTLTRNVTSLKEMVNGGEVTRKAD